MPLFVDEILQRFGAPRHYRAVLSYLLPIGIFIGSLWLALAAVGIDFVGIVLSFGVLSIVLSVGLSGIIGNVFAGIMIQISDLVQPGNDIEINGVRGTVLEMSLSNVLLQRHDDPDDFIAVPNSHFTQFPVRRHVGANDRSSDALRARLGAYQVSAKVE